MIIQEVGLDLNRARPLRFALLASVSATLLAAGVLVIAQQNRNNPQGLINRLLRAGGAPKRAASNEKHVNRSNMNKIPPEITRRVWDGKGRTRAPGDQAVSRQTVLITRRNPAGQFSQDPAPSQDRHPFWTFDERLIYFDSDRTSDTNPAPNPTSTFNVFRMFPDGSGITQVTTGSGNKIEPRTSNDGSRLAYVAGGTVAAPVSYTHLTLPTNREV